MNEDRPTFNRGAVRPIQCIKAGWRLIRDEYWLFLGISLVAYIIASFVPFNILLGPMMVGVHLCLLQKSRGKRMTFEMLFKGFDQFVQSLIAALLMLVPLFVLLVPGIVLFMAAVFAAMPRPQAGGPAPPPDFETIMGAYGLFYLYLFIVLIIVQFLFLFRSSPTGR